MADSKHAVLCDTCLQDKKRLSALTLCKECRELFCIECSSIHAVIPVTKEHLLIKISNAKTDSKFNVKLSSPVCSVCYLTGKGERKGNYFCDECRDIYCDTCKGHHLKLKATKNHTIYGIPIGGDISADRTGQHDMVKSIELASDFEGFNISPEDDRFDRAQAAVPTKKNRLQSLDVRILKKEDIDKKSRSQSLDVKVPEREDIDKVSAEFVTSFNAASKSDKEGCWFFGIASLSQERIVLLEGKDQKLKLFGKDFKMLSEVNLPGFGTGLTRLKDDTVAVLCDRQVLFYSIQQSSLVKESKSFKLKSGTYGISFNGSVFAVTCNDKTILVLSSDGTVLHEIKDIPNCGLSRLRNYYFVCIDPETNDIYFSHFCTVYCISTDGKLKSQSNFPFPLCYGLITFHNCLLVAAGTKIVLLTRDGKYQRTIFEDEDILTKAERISFDDKTHRLYITQGYSSIVTVLQLHY